MNTALLLSGGMDSIAIAYWKRPDITLTIDYGQAAANAEIQAASTFCREMGLRHEYIKFDCSNIGIGELSKKSPLNIAPAPEWWPYRNQLIITLACMKLISYGIKELWTGTIKTDDLYSDGRLDFYCNIKQLISMQEGGIVVNAPAIEMDAVTLINISKIPISLLAWAHSCHTGNYACGICRGCEKHRSVMTALGYDSY